MKYKFWMSSTRTTEALLKEANNPNEFTDEDDALVRLQEGEVGIRSDTGELITRKDGVLQTCGEDPNFTLLYNKYQGALRYKDSTAFKIIERSCKADVWGRAAMYLEEALRHPESIARTLEFFKEKARSHRQYLAQQSVSYEYATQTFVPKENTDAGNG